MVSKGLMIKTSGYFAYLSKYGVARKSSMPSHHLFAYLSKIVIGTYKQKPIKYSTQCQTPVGENREFAYHFFQTGKTQGI